MDSSSIPLSPKGSYPKRLRQAKQIYIEQIVSPQEALHQALNLEVSLPEAWLQGKSTQPGRIVVLFNNL